MENRRAPNKGDKNSGQSYLRVQKGWSFQEEEHVMANRRDIQRALNNRLELVKAGFTRRDLIKMGLMTSGGVLIMKGGLTHPASASDGGDNCELGKSPQPARVFVDPLPIPPQLPERPLSDPGLQFGKPPQECPNNAINPATGLPFEGRGQFNGKLRPGTDCFQFFKRFPPESFFISRMRENARFRITSDPHIPDQTIWGFNLGGNDPAITPGPTIVDQYDGARVVRRFNELPPQAQNGGFGVPEMSTHFHNFHDAPETDGGPCRFFFRGQYYDYYRTMQTPGFDDPNTTRASASSSLRARSGTTTTASSTRRRMSTRGCSA